MDDSVIMQILNTVNNLDNIIFQFAFSKCCAINLIQGSTFAKLHNDLHLTKIKKNDICHIILDKTIHNVHNIFMFALSKKFRFFGYIFDINIWNRDFLYSNKTICSIMLCFITYSKAPIFKLQYQRYPSPIFPNSIYLFRDDID